MGEDPAAYAAGEGRDSSEHAGTLGRAGVSRISLSTASAGMWMTLWITSAQSEDPEAAGAGEEVLEDVEDEDVEDVDEEDPDRESVR